MQFSNVTAEAKANVYFDGKVVSHGITLEDGSTKTFGLIYPGVYHFATEAAERMEIIDGECIVVLDGSDDSSVYAAGQYFEVPANAGFTITVSEGIGQYICSYIETV
ncbi:pyrimidine/purine nucleoside phosphorylase [Verrucomicrobiaceae bacterium N1E253]|uniref:Pyrimidine/purine nucleoside phosphorylase n=1 Tax=Oceaniferula marina TaxID=2748318 RepID=A0A851GIH9_9BACT|nr:pyrimidine/purine nucleoside phosphorylase [Oceaniferula marina]NWK54034.1 pyrimidine/purine nucleoside phosphorylase [Oceaniferula marina]